MHPFQIGPWGSNFADESPYRQIGINPSSSFSFPSEFHQHTRHQPPVSTCASTSCQCFSRGFFPFGVFPAARSNLYPGGPNHSGFVSPSEFLTLSTPCSPRDLPDLFHSGPALGISLRGILPSASLYVLSNATTLSKLLRKPISLLHLSQGFCRREDFAQVLGD